MFVKDILRMVSLPKVKHLFGIDTWCLLAQTVLELAKQPECYLALWRNSCTRGLLFFLCVWAPWIINIIRVWWWFVVALFFLDFLLGYMFCCFVRLVAISMHYVCIHWQKFLCYHSQVWALCYCTLWAGVVFHFIDTRMSHPLYCSLHCINLYRHWGENK